MTPSHFPTVNWPYAPILARLALALVLGIFVGLERERRGKEAGVRTFGFAALLGRLGGLLGQAYALLSLGMLGLLVVFLNVQRLRTNETAELTTSIALLLVGFTGVLCGLGHTFTPVAVAVVTAALLAWKEPLKDFSLGMTEEELRSGILLGILTFLIYPALPIRAIDPWNLLEPRVAWATVILIAGIGFVNYILWKQYGARGVELTGFLAGLVNSTVAVTELAARTSEAGAGMELSAYRGVMLATSAMLIRNVALLAILSARTLATATIPLALMLSTCTGVGLLVGSRRRPAAPPTLSLTSPFSLQSAFKFGLVFLCVDIAGTLAQRWLGPLGYYVVSFVGGLVSSASAVASAGALAARGKLPFEVAGNGAVLASIASVLVNLPVIARVGRLRSLTRRLAIALGTVALAGLLGGLVQAEFYARGISPVAAAQPTAAAKSSWASRPARPLVTTRAKAPRSP